jgi:diadenosine tetraphosphate (Ap4A) HIT family hydrolase
VEHRLSKRKPPRVSDGSQPWATNRRNADRRAESADRADNACLLCEILQAPPGDRAWYDCTLADYDEFIVLPALGAQVEGYVLVVPRAHVYSCGALDELRLGVLSEIIERICARLSNHYGSCIVFEHGSCGGVQRAGSCIDHAHLHIVPTAAPIDVLARRDRPFTRISGLTALKDHADRPYLALQTQSGTFHVADGTGAPGQYFRRLVAVAEAAPLEWDYAMFPNYDAVRSTIADVTLLLSGGVA